MVIDDHIDVSVRRCDDGRYAVVWVRASCLREFRFRSASAAIVASDKITERAKCGGVPSPTVAEFAAEWMTDYVKAECSVGTITTYESEYRRLVAPDLGDVHLDSVTHALSVTYVNGLLRDRGFPAAIAGRGTLSAILGVAEKWGYIDHNPV